MRKKQSILKLIFQVAMIFGLIVSFTSTTMAAGNVKKGKRKYSEFCTPCHGKNGQGDGTRMLVEKPHLLLWVLPCLVLCKILKNVLLVI